MVQDNRGDAEGHSLENSSTSEFPDAGKGQQVSTLQLPGEILVFNPTDQNRIGGDPVALKFLRK